MTLSILFFDCHHIEAYRSGDIDFEFELHLNCLALHNINQMSNQSGDDADTYPTPNKYTQLLVFVFV